MTVRYERVHEYKFWSPDGRCSGVLRINSDPTDDICEVVIDHDDGADAQPGKPERMLVIHEAVPVLIAALTSYQSRIGAAENEVAEEATDE